MTRRLVAFLALWLAPALAVSLPTTTAWAQKDDNIKEMALAVGETRTISAAGVKNYSEGVTGVVDVRLTPDGAQFVITGKRPGNTTLLLIFNNGNQTTYEITVSTRSPAAVEHELEQLLEGQSGVRVRRIGGRFFIEGGVTTKEEQERIKRIADLYPGQVESLVSVGSGAPDRKLLVRLDFFFIQYDKHSRYKVGVGWPESIGGQAGNQQIIQSQFNYDFIANTATAAQASVVNQPLPRLDIAAVNGWAKVLKQSTAITSNGMEAKFEANAEQNYQIAQGLSTSIKSIKYGTSLKVLPRFDPKTNELELKIEADVGYLIPPHASTPIPGRQTTLLDTFVNLKLGQALVLSGIRSSDVRNDMKGIPGLSSIPILGVLFGSMERAREDLEGAVFVVPSIIETVPKSSLEVIKNALAAFDDYSGDIDSADSYNKTPPAAK